MSLEGWTLPSGLQRDLRKKIRRERARETSLFFLLSPLTRTLPPLNHSTTWHAQCTLVLHPRFQIPQCVVLCVFSFNYSPHSSLSRQLSCLFILDTELCSLSSQLGLAWFGEKLSSLPNFRVETGLTPTVIYENCNYCRLGQ